MYNPNSHLVNIQGKPYYPAGWRLYELVLKYPVANFETELLYIDVEHNLVVVKCRLYLGIDWATAEKKTEAVKSGRLDQVDRVETACKARCARDFGISTEYALEQGKPAKITDREQAREEERRRNIG